MKYIILFFLGASLTVSAQRADTLTGFLSKIKGEDINYFSPLHEFAPTALLTRMNGQSAIEWESPVYKGQAQFVTYEFLLGHSTGTSKAERHFDVALNNSTLFTIATPMHQKGHYTLKGSGAQNSTYYFALEEYDVNNDAFGKLFITVSAQDVKEKAVFSIAGKNEDSRDWLMIFKYQPGLKISMQPTALVTRKEKLRQVNVFAENPYRQAQPMRIQTGNGEHIFVLKPGYNKLNLLAFPTSEMGTKPIRFIVGEKDTVEQSVVLYPASSYTFHIIHHSHNDIGYSHLQPEVEQIQNNNIRMALRWIKSGKGIWHIESLWAVENFLQTATPEEETNFVNAVKAGYIVLSINYANILSGLCQPEEQNWVLEYGKILEKKYGFTIKNAMITDIPGITRSALLSYVNNQIPYLAIGPNFVESLPDQGDRVGGIIREQGDKLFYWKPSANSNKKLLVWTAGRGYSYFHGISDSEKQQKWEKRISDYSLHLTKANYPYDIVQLRYTKNADNGPVDTSLTTFVQNWNERYLSPRLVISSVDKLFADFEKKYSGTIPEYTGEISPYWEDGAFSTLHEEMQNRNLAIKTIALEKYARANSKYNQNASVFYRLRRSIVMFHEHTWGAWCSIYDPETDFTKEQWRIKKAFVDSAEYYYQALSKKLNYNYRQPKPETVNAAYIKDISVDPNHGGISALWVNGKNIVGQNDYNYLFEPIYMLGINPMQQHRPKDVSVKVMEDNSEIKIVAITASLPNIKGYTALYTLYKKQGRLICHYSFDKAEEKNKESLHIALPFAMHKPKLRFGSMGNMQDFPHTQLAGSNKDFICAEQELQLVSDNMSIKILSPLPLYEPGSIIDENTVNGTKVWKKSQAETSSLYLYVLNNYWHTNFKAYQSGKVSFDVELRVQKSR